MGTRLMARKSADAGKGKGKAPAVPKTIGIRVSPEYAEWVERLARANRTTIAGLVDQALAGHAERIGFDETPPER